ncbi:Uncharacterized protein GNX_2874 [Leptospira interrogans serovar Canicola]|nr:Uncharacterized protein GNX_2874 [Leptospira interrogans serovar Canicola]
MTILEDSIMKLLLTVRRYLSNELKKNGNDFKKSEKIETVGKLKMIFRFFKILDSNCISCFFSKKNERMQFRFIWKIHIEMDHLEYFIYLIF